MSPQYEPVRSADDLIFNEDAEKEKAALTESEKADLVFLLGSLWKHPEQTIDVRGARGPVRAITYNGSLWVLYCLDRQAEGSIYVTILHILRQEEASTECPEPALDLAVARYWQGRP